MTDKQRTLLSIKQFSAKHPSFPQGGLRHLVFQANPRMNSRGDVLPGNGLSSCGAIVRVGRKVLIDEDRFFAWVDAQNGAGDALPAGDRT